MLFFVLMLGSCAAGQPKDPNNICYLLKDNRGWYKDAQRARKRWGLPVHVGFAFVHRESTFIANAKPPRKRLLGVPLGRSSSAFGYAQATDEAWSDYKKSTGGRFVRRSDFGDALDFIGWYNHQSNRRLRIRKNDAYNLYLAYYNGHSGYAKGGWKKSAAIKGYAKKASRQSAIYANQLLRCT
jgi:hypothetical protein